MCAFGVGIDAVLKARLVKDVADALDDDLLKGDGRLLHHRPHQPSERDDRNLDVAHADSLLDAIGSLNALKVTPNRWLIDATNFIAVRKLRHPGIM